MSAAFADGTAVRVRDDWPERGSTQVHIRTPGYLRGRHGRIEQTLGAFANPEELAFGRPGLPPKRLYRVVFPMGELWPGGARGDTVAADIYEHWLEPVGPENRP